MQVSPQDSGSSAGSATGGQQSSGAATGEASGSSDAAAGRGAAAHASRGPDMPFMRSSPRKHPGGGWMGRAAAAAASAAAGDSIGNTGPKILHQDVFMDFPDDFGPPTSSS